MWRDRLYNEVCPEVLTHLRCNTAILTAKWCNHHSCPSAHITHMHKVQGPHHRCSKQYGICLGERKRTNMNHKQLSWHKNDNQAKHTRRLNKTIRSKTATDEPTKGEQERTGLTVLHTKMIHLDVMILHHIWYETLTHSITQKGGQDHSGAPTHNTLSQRDQS